MSLLHPLKLLGLIRAARAAQRDGMERFGVAADRAVSACVTAGRSAAARCAERDASIPTVAPLEDERGRRRLA